MNKLWLGVIGIVLVAAGSLIESATEVKSQSSECTNIRDVDARNMCRAKAEHKSSYCTNIQDVDSRNMCRAQVEHKVSYCTNIKDSDKRSFCRATLGN